MDQSLSFDTIVDFLQRYKKYENIFQDLRLHDFKSNVSHIKLGLKLLQEVFAEYNKLNSPYFNLFNLLSAEYNEVLTHSAMLSNLLNPSGNHGQGFLFLESFLKYCNSKLVNRLGGFIYPTGNIRDSIWIIEKEKSTFYGRLDIVISAVDLKYLIVIENKVYALEQEDQLKRYINWIKSIRSYSDKILIYLTLLGEKSTTGDGSEFLMSYQKDIFEWINEVNPYVKSYRVKDALKQYLDVIKNI